MGCGCTAAACASSCEVVARTAQVVSYLYIRSQGRERWRKGLGLGSWCT